MIELSCPIHDFSGKIQLPFSKSESNRALIIQAISDSEIEIHNPSNANDTEVLKKALQQVQQKESVIDVEDAGTAMRFLTALLSITEGKWILQGSDRMHERPIGKLVNAINQLGGEVKFIENKGFPPLEIIGKQYEGGQVSIDASTSSQFISALLMIAPKLKKGLSIVLEGDIVSSPYLEMTFKMLKKAGINVIREGNELLIAPQNFESTSLIINADWSAASYWYHLVALSNSAHIKLKNLHVNSIQGDEFVKEIYKEFGVITSTVDDGVLIEKHEGFELSKDSISIDLKECPDLAQTLAATCVGLKTKASITGLSTLVIKETNRLVALKNELGKFGASIHHDNISMTISPKECDINASIIEVKTYEDHRMAMCLAPLALKCKSLKFDDETVVKKSYPNYWRNLKQVGFTI